MALRIIDIAKVCHEANRAFCEVLGDNSQVPWEEAPDWQIETCIDGVKFCIDNYDLPDSASHENWLVYKAIAGWKYGPIKDEKKKKHPCMVPFEELPADQQAKDALFAGIVRALSPLLDEEVEL